MEIIGRVTKDATVATLKDGRTVVNFSVAMHDYYKQKGSSESKQVTTYVQCAYWVSSKIAPFITKGVLIELSGRIGVQAYKVQDEVKATLTLHVNNIKLHGKVKDASPKTVAEVPAATSTNEEALKDLPF